MTIPGPHLLVALAAAGLTISAGPPAAAPPTGSAGAPQTDSTSAPQPVPDAADRQAPGAEQRTPVLRAELDRALARARNAEQHLEQAIAALDAGSPAAEVLRALRDAGVTQHDFGASGRAGAERRERWEGRGREPDEPSQARRRLTGRPDGLRGNRRGQDGAEGRTRDERGEGGGPRDGLMLTAEQRQEVIAFLRQYRPDLQRHLDQMIKDDPEEAERRLHAFGRRLGPLIKLSRDDPAAFELKVAEIDLSRQAWALARKIVFAARPDGDPSRVDPLTAQLREIVARQFDTRLRIQEHELKSVGNRLDRLKAALSDQQARRETLIDEKMRDLMRLVEENLHGDAPHTGRDVAPEDPDRIGHVSPPLGRAKPEPAVPPR